MNAPFLRPRKGIKEAFLKYYPKVRMIIATDFSKEMVYTAKENAKKYPEKNVKFGVMDNLIMNFPNDLFDLVSARHTKINAKGVYDCLTNGGAIVIAGVPFAVGSERFRRTAAF